MELQDYLNVIRKRWMIIAAVALVTLGLAAAYTALVPADVCRDDAVLRVDLG